MNWKEEQRKNPEHQNPQLASTWEERLQDGGWHREKCTEHLRTTPVHVREITAELGEKMVKVLLRCELRYHLICFERLQ